MPHEVATQLRLLTTSSGDAGALARDLDEILALVLPAVPSCIAVSINLDCAGGPVTFTAVAEPAELRPVRASLFLRLPRRRTRDSEADGPVLLFHASEARAFDRMTVDLVALLDMDASRATVDGHLVPPAGSGNGGGVSFQLDDLSAVNRALGVLLDRGLAPRDGHAELRRLARAGGISVAAAAGRLLAALPLGASPAPPAPTDDSG